MSVTLMHPAKAVGWNEMPFGRDTCVIPSDIVLDRVPRPSREGEIRGSEAPVCTNATITKFLWLLSLQVKSQLHCIMCYILYFFMAIVFTAKVPVMLCYMLYIVFSHYRAGLYNITNCHGKVAEFCLFKQAYRIGDDIIGTCDFSSASVPCVQVSNLVISRCHFF